MCRTANQTSKFLVCPNPSSSLIQNQHAWTSIIAFARKLNFIAMQSTLTHPRVVISFSHSKRVSVFWVMIHFEVYRTKVIHKVSILVEQNIEFRRSLTKHIKHETGFRHKPKQYQTPKIPFRFVEYMKYELCRLCHLTLFQMHEITSSCINDSTIQK